MNLMSLWLWLLVKRALNDDFLCSCSLFALSRSVLVHCTAVMLAPVSSSRVVVGSWELGGLRRGSESKEEHTAQATVSVSGMSNGRTKQEYVCPSVCPSS